MPEKQPIPGMEKTAQTLSGIPLIKQRAIETKSGYSFSKASVDFASTIQNNGHNVSEKRRKSLADELEMYEHLPENDKEAIQEGRLVIVFDAAGHKYDVSSKS